MKIFKRSVWVMLTIFFALLFAISVVGQMITSNYVGWINKYFGTSSFVTVVEETDSNADTEYYKSDAVLRDADGNPIVTTDADGRRHQIYDNAAMRNNSMEVAERVVEEGSVLLWNKNNALPLQKNNNVSLFGITSLHWLFHGDGSGHVDIALRDTFKDALTDRGLNVNGKLYSAYRVAQQGHGRGTMQMSDHSNRNYVEFKVGEIGWDTLMGTTAGDVTSDIAKYGDAALFVIARNGSEDGDTAFKTPECLDQCYLDLSKEEADVLQHLVDLKKQGSIKKIVLIINSAAAVQLKNIAKYDIDACLWVGIGGNASFYGTADLLMGNANPSGHLTDTWAYDADSAPATENFGDYKYTECAGVPNDVQYTNNTKYVAYAEGIYVGYRYYETRYEDLVMKRGSAGGVKGVKAGSGTWNYTEEVAYPFGYGGSYTNFEWSGYSVKTVDDGYEVTVTVKNTGNVAGKDVVEVYLQKPYTDYDKTNHIEKAAVELVGFQKTDLLQPGASQTVTVTVSPYDFKSYDAYNAGTYILEKGDYFLTAGTDAHDAVNNILAAKGYSVNDGMDKNGRENFAEKITFDADDHTTYSVSPFTGKPISNQFENADINLYEGTKGQEIAYLSRSDWEGTYPAAVTLTCTDSLMLYDMQYGHDPAVKEGDTMPLYGTVTSELGELTLAMLMEFGYDDPIWEDLLNQLTWEESNLLVTLGSASIAGAESIAAPGFKSNDGPCGITRSGIPEGLDTQMAFPCNGLLASSFNPELVEELGNAFGMEIMHIGYTGIYGTGADIHRCAYSGRTWEYFSEDGFLSGKIYAAESQGLMNRGVVLFTKHFALNDQEENRYGGCVWANEQSIREIYLKAFEAGITEGHTNGLMSSFNRIGCTWAGAHSGLLTEVLRNEWGFVGFVETDAGVGAHMLDGVAMANAVIAGQDNWMTGGNTGAFNAYKNNPTVCRAIRTACHRILYTQLHSNAMNGFSVNTHVRSVTPWWQMAIIGIEICFGVLMGICLVMAASSFVIAAKGKNKTEKKNKEE